MIPSHRPLKKPAIPSQMEEAVSLIPFHRPTKKSRMAFQTVSTVDLIPSQSPVKKLAIPFQMEEAVSLIPFHSPTKKSRIAFHTVSTTDFIPSQRPLKKSEIAVHTVVAMFLMVQKGNRYVVEQYLLPGELYTSGPMLMLRLMQDVNAVMEEVYAVAEAEYPGPVFSETHRVYYRDPGSMLIIRVEMHTPEEALLSRAVYFCYNDRNGENQYFTSELAATGKYFLCSRPDSDVIQHMLICDAPGDANEEYDLVADRYWKLVIEGGLKQLESLRAG